MNRSILIAALFALASSLIAHSADDQKDPPEVAAAIKKLKSLDPRVKVKAIEEIAPLAVDSDSAAAALCDAVLYPTKSVSIAAMQALEKSRPSLYKPLSVLILDPDEFRRVNAFTELGLEGDKASPSLCILHAMLRSELKKGATYRGTLSTIQKKCFDTIRKINPEDVETVKLYKLLAAPDNKHSYAKYEAISFLGDWAGDEKRRKEVYSLVKAGLNDSVCKPLSIQVLGSFGLVAKDSLPALKALKLSPDARIRELATVAVDKIENP